MIYLLVTALKLYKSNLLHFIHNTTTATSLGIIRKKFCKLSTFHALSPPIHLKKRHVGNLNTIVQTFHFSFLSLSTYFQKAKKTFSFVHSAGVTILPFVFFFFILSNVCLVVTWLDNIIISYWNCNTNEEEKSYLS